MSVLSKIQSGILEGYELIGEIEVSVDSTTVTFSNLNGDEDVEYIVIVVLKNPTGSASEYYLYPNGITANHSSQYLHATGTSISAYRRTTPHIAQIDYTNEEILSVVHLCPMLLN